MDFYVIIGSTSCALQILVLFLLFYGLILKRKMKFKGHGIIMSVATFVHLFLVLGIMMPSFALAVVPHYIIASPFEFVSIVGLIHGVLGILAVVFGVRLVFAWQLSKDVSGCFERKKVMKHTLVLWITTLVLGLALFWIFYGPMLIV
jgi:hypothetical protein